VKAKVHIHTDCAFFAGSENMPAVLLDSRPLRAEFDVSFSYRHSQAYEEGLRQRVKMPVSASALSLPDPSMFHRAVSWLLLAKFWMFAWDLALLAALLRRRRPQILHINNGGYPGAVSCRAAAAAGRLCGVPYIVMVVNNLALPYTGVGRRSDYLLDRLTVRCVDRFVTGSRAAAERLSEVLRLPAGRAVALHNGVPARPPDKSREHMRSSLGVPEPGKVVIGMVALMEPRKGHRVLLEAVEHLRRSDPRQNMAVRLEGDGPERAALEEEARRRGLADVVRFTRGEANIANFILAVDIVVLSSVALEDFPNIVLEAMAGGKPVVASRLAGIPEQIEDGCTGLLVEAGNVAGLAEALAQLIRDPDLRAKLGRAGRARFEERFTAEAAVERYTGLYRGLLERPRAG